VSYSIHITEELCGCYSEAEENDLGEIPSEEDDDVDSVGLEDSFISPSMEISEDEESSKK
ncbi:hypothetical protein RYX36_004699, partial [Vicia faba]